MHKTLKRRLELEKLMGIDSLLLSPSNAKPKSESGGDKLSLEKQLAGIEEEVRKCDKCELSAARTQGVFARGCPNSNLMIIGEAPGGDEDKQGKPFVGRAGKLLDKMLLAIGLDESDYYITNIVKSRPPDNRDPLRGEIEACRPYLNSQIELIKPKIIVTLGLPASNTLLDNNMSMGDMRGRWFKYNDIPVLPIYHPAYLLRSPGKKSVVWEDLKKLAAAL